MKIKYSLLIALLLTIAWPPIGFNALLFVAFIPAFYLIDSYDLKSNKQIFYYSFLAFALFNLACSYWIWNASAAGMVIAVLLNALLMTLPLLFYYKVKNISSQRNALIAFISAWVSMEYFHMHWDLSWPWFTLGNAFAASTTWIQWYEYTGVFGGTIWVLVVNALIYLALQQVQNTSMKAKLKTFAPAFLVLIIPILISKFIYFQYEEKINPCHIVIAQPNIDPYNEKFSGMDAQAQMQKLLDLSAKDAQKNTEFFIWPETALSLTISEDQLESDQSIIQIRNFLTPYKNASLITGANTYLQYASAQTPTARVFSNGQCCYDVFNTGLLIENGSAIQKYHKSKLVAGVEQMPYPKLLKFLEPFALKLGGTFGSLGTQVTPSVLYNSSGIGAATVICYESVYGEHCANFIKQGAQFIAIITNDGWWGNTAGYKQHALYAKLRAIENRRSIARSANTGISSFIDQRGDVVQASNWWEAQSLSGSVNLNENITYYTDHGDFLARWMIAVFLFYFIHIVYFRFVAKK